MQKVSDFLFPGLNTEFEERACLTPKSSSKLSQSSGQFRSCFFLKKVYCLFKESHKGVYKMVQDQDQQHTELSAPSHTRHVSL